MCDDFIHPGLVEDHRLSRRSFGLMTAAVAGAPAAAVAQSNVVEKDVQVKTADGIRPSGEHVLACFRCHLRTQPIRQRLVVIGERCRRHYTCSASAGADYGAQFAYPWM